MPPPRTHPTAKPIWPALAFLVGFTIGVIALSYYYLFPALRSFLEARRHGDTSGAQAISATSALLLAVVLLILVAGVLLTFRLSRLFFPRNNPPRTKTQYVDAWAESAKRMPTPSADDEE